MGKDRQDANKEEMKQETGNTKMERRVYLSLNYLIKYARLYSNIGAGNLPYYEMTGYTQKKTCAITIWGSSTRFETQSNSGARKIYQIG